MIRWGLSGNDIENILRQLTESRFVNDLRFARAYVHDKYVYSRWGRKKIASGLYAKRIPRATIEEALDGIDRREYAAIAFRVLSSKLRQLPADMPEFDKRRRLMAFAQSRGYETNLTIRILESSRLWHGSTE